MPELPEVETIRRDLEQSILRKTFHKVVVCDPLVLRSPQQTFISRLKGQVIHAVIRRGKALILALGQDSSRWHLVIQLMMTGQLVTNGKSDAHTRIIFEFNDGTTLLYNDQRRFGQLRLTRDLKEIKHLNALGPEPLEEGFNATYIFEHTRHSRRPIKNLLLDHTFVAGIGNIYASETLFRSGIRPHRIASRLKHKDACHLHQKTVEVLMEAIQQRGTSMRNYRDGQGQKGLFSQRISVYAREGMPCLICQSTIKRIVQAGRSTFYCSQCQK